MVVDTEGCFADEKSDRVMEARMTDVGMTNEVRHVPGEAGGRDRCAAISRLVYMIRSEKSIVLSMALMNKIQAQRTKDCCCESLPITFISW